MAARIRADWDAFIRAQLSPPVTVSWDWRGDKLWLVIQWRDGSANQPIMIPMGDGSREQMAERMHAAIALGEALTELEK